jgi:hypothetical protein
MRDFCGVFRSRQDQPNRVGTGIAVTARKHGWWRYGDYREWGVRRDDFLCLRPAEMCAQERQGFAEVAEYGEESPESQQRSAVGEEPHFD